MQDFTNEKAALEMIAPRSDEFFSNEELEPRLVNFQQAISDTIFSAGMSDKIRPQDLTRFLEDLAQRNGVVRDDTFCRLSRNMHSLGQQIGGLKNGAKGEERTRLGLRNLEFETNVKIFYNITLGKDPSDRTEFDAIVLTTYGIFVVETKNYSGNAHITEKGILCRDDGTSSYNLGEKMNTKQFLLRSCLGRYSKVPYLPMLLYVNEEFHLTDDFLQIPIVYCSTASQYIIDHFNGEELLSPDDLREIEGLIRENQVIAPKYPCRIKCQEIIDDLIVVLTRIANAKPSAPALPAPTPIYQQVCTAPVVDHRARKRERRKTFFKNAVIGLSCFFAGGAGGVAIYRAYINHITSIKA